MFTSCLFFECRTALGHMIVIHTQPRPQAPPRSSMLHTKIREGLGSKITWVCLHNHILQRTHYNQFVEKVYLQSLDVHVQCDIASMCSCDFASQALAPTCIYQCLTLKTLNLDGATSTGHIKVITLLPFPHQRKVCTEGLLDRHAFRLRHAGENTESRYSYIVYLYRVLNV